MSLIEEEDLKEALSILENVKSPAIKEVLEGFVARTQGLILQKQAHANPSPAPKAIERIDAETSPKSNDGNQLIPIKASASSGDNQQKWTPISTFSFDQDDKTVRVYISQSMAGVGMLDADAVSCVFEADSIDLRVVGLNGKDFRFYRKPLEHDIEPSRSYVKVKSNSIGLSLCKAKGEYGISDHWTSLVETKRSIKRRSKEKKDPTHALQEMMKDLYDSGDDNIRRAIGEAMLKSRQERPMM